MHSFLLACAVALLILPAQAAAELGWEPLREPGSGGWITGMRISPHDSRRMLVSGDMLGVGLSEDGGESWQATFGFKSWEMADITWSQKDPKTVWVASTSGPYRSVDGGRNWELRRNGMPPPLSFGYSAMIEKVLLDPRDEAHMLAFGGSSRRWEDHGKSAHGVVWESRNAGGDWTRLATLTADGSSTAPDARGINIVSAANAAGDFNHLYAAVSGRGIYVSIDGGKSWAVSNEGLGTSRPERVIAHPTEKQSVFCALDNRPASRGSKGFEPGGIYKSTDGGQHWISISNGLVQDRHENESFTARYKAFAISAGNPDAMYAANHAWFQGGLFATKDGGAHWTPFAGEIPRFFPAGLPGTVMEVDPRSPDIAWCLGAEHMLRTADGGKTWSDAGNFSPAQTKAGWRGRGYSGMCATQIRFNPAVKGQSMLQALDAGRAWLSRDHLQTWTRHLDQPDAWGAGNDTAFAGANVIYVTTSRGSFTGLGRSRDAGATWEMLAGRARGLPEMHAAGDALGIYARPEEPEKVWACIGGSLYASVDGGDHWTVTASGQGLAWIAPDPSKPGRFYISGAKNVYATEDGKTLTAIGGPKVPGRLAVDARGRVYVTASNSGRNGLWRFDGKEWARLFDDPWVEAVAIDPSVPGRLAVATNQNPYLDFSGATGVWLSSDGGQSWSAQNAGLAMLRGYVLAFNLHDPEQLIFGTQGRGFFQARWPRAFAPAGTRHYSSTAEDARFAQPAP